MSFHTVPKAVNTEHPAGEILDTLEVALEEGAAMAHVPTASYPICPLCSEHVELETANTDERGKAVHEECYVSRIIEPTRGPTHGSRFRW